MSTIELSNVTKYFGSLAAVRDVDLSVGAGETVCLLGPSGCGKTTTLRIVAGLEAASDGDVLIAGRRMNDLSPSERDIAMVFQFYALYPSLTVAENIAFPLYYERTSSADRERRLRGLRRKLQRAVDGEDFERAAQIRDQIRALEPS